MIAMWIVLVLCIAPPLAAADRSPLKYTALLGDQASITSAAVDDDGNAYITGLARGPLPVTPGAFQTEYKPGTCTEALLNARSSAHVSMRSRFRGQAEPRWNGIHIYH